MKISSITSVLAITNISADLLGYFCNFFFNNGYTSITVHPNEEEFNTFTIKIEVVHDTRNYLIKEKLTVWEGAGYPGLVQIEHPLAKENEFVAVVRIEEKFYQIGDHQDDYLSALELTRIYETEKQPTGVFNDQGKKVENSA